jgi:DNA-binding XRE family transcriptional regulator
MDTRARKRLESAGWTVGGASEFLGLTEEEAAIVELKVGLANAVREQRSRRRMTQDQLGRLLGSSQSRVAKMEAADPSVSIDLMVRSLLRMGASRKDVACYIAAPGRKRAA